jgi:predicted DNA-binding transcriptional regulator YafY
VQLVIPVEAPDQVAGTLMRLAPEVEVLAPAALRQAVIDRLQQAFVTYRIKAPRR